MDNLHVHYTRTHKIHAHNGWGWEFSCKECGYRVRYIHSSELDKPTLEIIHMGDPTARHTNNPPHEHGAQAITDLSHEEGWLTAELRNQIGDILKRFDWN